MRKRLDIARLLPGSLARSLALVVGLAAACTAARAEPCRLPGLNIPVEIVNYRPVVTMTLNGAPVRMLVDTGAFFSLLTEATVTELKLKRGSMPFGITVSGYAGDLNVGLTRVKEVKLQGVPFADIEFIAGINELGSGIGGVLGRNFLSMTDIEFDLAHGNVRMVFPKGDCDQVDRAYWAGDAPVIQARLDVTRSERVPPIRVVAQLNGTRVTAMFDTGAPFTAVSLPSARRAGLKEADLTPVGSTGGGGEGRVRSWTAPIATFEMGGQKILNNRLAVNDVDDDRQGMLVGLDYFLSHRIYVSWKQRLFFATWNGGPVFSQTWKEDAANSAYAAPAAALAEDDADGFARRGRASAARKDNARALVDLTRASELAPGNAAHLEARATVHLAMRSIDKALADLDAALQLDAGLADARMRRAQVRHATGDAAGAQADLDALDAALPRTSHVRNDMALLYAKQQRLPEALKQWDHWVATHPRDGNMPSILNSRCWLRAQLGVELALALDDCKRAVDMADSEPSFHDSLGWTYLRLNDDARAVKAFDAALKLKPASGWSLYGRALVRLRLGQAEAAARDLAAARQHEPGIDAEVKRAGFPVPDKLPGA